MLTTSRSHSPHAHVYPHRSFCTHPRAFSAGFAERSAFPRRTPTESEAIAAWVRPPVAVPISRAAGRSAQMDRPTPGSWSLSDPRMGTGTESEGRLNCGGC